MDGYLRQSTASQSRLIGPFVDDTDFTTEETALTIANTDIKLRANGITLANKNSGGGTHQVNGNYSVTWDATDTANVGELKYTVKMAGALQVFGVYVVLEEAVYDAMFAAAAPGYVTNAPVNVAQWNGSNVASPDTAGYPKITIKSGSGTGEVDLDAGRVKLTEAQIDQIVDETLDEVNTTGTHNVTNSVGVQIRNAGSAGTPPSADEIADEVETRTLLAVSDVVNSVTVGGYETNQSPAEQILITPANKIRTNANGDVYV